MKKLIEALTIFEVSEEDQTRLKALGFLWSSDDGSWISFHFGRA
jgi:hypothetical protein